MRATVTCIWASTGDVCGLGVLSPAELLRAERCTGAGARLRFVAGRVALRTLAGVVLGVERQDVPLSISTTGRPELLGTGWFVALSHTLDVVVAAASRRPVGVDVEPRPVGPVDEVLVRATLPPRDLERWLALPGAEQGATFVRHWVRVEAALKAGGAGLGTDPASVAAGRRRVAGCRVVALDAPAGFLAALAVRQPLWSVDPRVVRI